MVATIVSKQARGSGSAQIEDLEKFFADGEHFEVLADVNGTCPSLSLRTITWFVSKGLGGCAPGMRDDYAAQLKRHTRRNFDPFRRSSRVVVASPSGKEFVESTVGQMNFFRWLIESGAWGWLLKNRASVHADAVRVTARGKGVRAECGGFRRLAGPHIVVFD